MSHQPNISHARGFTRIVAIAFVALLPACGGGGGGGGDTPPASPGTRPSVAASTSAIAPGDATCAQGGILVETGIDENRNGLLDPDEVDTSEKVCNGLPGADGMNGADGAPGVDGRDSLVAMNPEPVGLNCPNGGLRIDAGIDSNANGSLDPAEITQTGFVCDGGDGGVGWGVATLVGTNDIGSAAVAQVSMGSDGSAVAVWQQWTGLLREIRANRYQVGVGWGIAEALPMPQIQNGDASGPRVAMDAAGNVLAVWQWQDHDTLRYSLWVNHFPVGSGWKVAESLVASDTADMRDPQVAMDSAGNAVAVWIQRDDTTRGIRARHYDADSGWGPVEAIQPDTAVSASTPWIAMGANGNAVAVWVQWDATAGRHIRASLFAPGTGWSTPVEIGAEVADLPRVAMDATGNAVAVWEKESTDGIRTGIWASLYQAGGGWGAATLIEPGDTGKGADPWVAMDANGNALVAWKRREASGEPWNIWANRYAAGTGWEGARLIETHNAGRANSPRLAMDPAGNATVVWSQFRGTGIRDIWSNRYVANAGWGRAELVEANDAGAANDPWVAMDPAGNAIAVWNQADSTNSQPRYDIWANRWLAPQ